MGKEDFKCSVNPVDPAEVAEKWRFDSIQEAVNNARAIIVSKRAEELSDDNISFSGGSVGASFEVNVQEGFLVKINYRDEGPAYNIEVFIKGENDLETYRNYRGGMSYLRDGDQIVKCPMSREVPFSEEENEKFINKPIKEIQSFIEKQRGLQK